MTILNLPEEEKIDEKIKKAMESIEDYKPELKGILPKDEYFRLTRTDKSIPMQLLKNFSNIPKETDGDMFGQIYEYFLGNFALAEGQGGGEFFTPRSVVRLMVEIIEPHNGTVFDPACGSGGMFVQSAKFIERRIKEMEQNEAADLFVYGQEKTLETVKLTLMNIAVNGLRGDIRQANTYYEDPFGSFGKFDYVLANPPFNVDDVSLNRVEADRRFNTYGVPRKKTKAKKKEKGAETVPNANYLWINIFATSLKPAGRAALVMANSASDARHSEADIRKSLIENNLIYGMLTLPSNMFYTVTLPATLWFFDWAKKDDCILFTDARNILTQIDRAHREFSEEQIKDIAIISRLHRGNREECIKLIDGYFERGMEKLICNKEQLKNVAIALINFLKAFKENDFPDFSGRLEDIRALENRYQDYHSRYNAMDVDKANALQRELAGAFHPFFTEIHDMLMVIDKKVRRFEKDHINKKEVKSVKAELESLHKESKRVGVFLYPYHLAPGAVSRSQI
jgi:type I restriction enzyme M protein